MGRGRWCLVGVVLGSLLPGVTGRAVAEAEPARPIVFSTALGEIARINPDGSGRTVIATPTGEKGATSYHLPDLSADGSKVVFEECYQSYSPPLPTCWLNVVNIDGSGFHRVTEPGGGLAPRWSPDGRRIAYSPTHNGVTRIVVVNADGSDERTLAEGSYPDWSPDGTTIVFSAATPDKTPDDWQSGALFVVRADGSRPARQLTRDLEDKPSCPTWSPDGNTIAFSSNGRDGMRIELVNANGSRIRHAPFATAPHRAYGRPAWSPDSRSIAVAEYPASGTTYPLIVHDLTTGASHQVMKDEGLSPSWT